MRQHQTPPTTSFEDRLLGELRALVAERGAAATEAEASTGTPAWRRGPRLALVSTAVTAVVAAALIVSAGGGNTPVAYAVEPQSEGMVSVEIRSLEDEKGLEEALGEAGIPASVTYLATGTACKEPRLRPAPPLAPGDRGQVIMTGNVGPGGKDVPSAFLISRDTVGPGQTLVITASPPGEDGFDVQAEVAEGRVEPCKPVPASPNGG